jgi:uncharacterized membrane protein HdeD (DUF308 family)
MERVLKNTKVSIILNSILSIGLGVVLILYPQITMTAICYAFGAILVVCALFHVFFYFKYKKQNSFVNFNIIIAAITGVIGIWIISKPSMVLLIIPIIFGIILVIHAIVDVKQAIELKDSYYKCWWAALIVAVFNIGFAAILFWNPFKVVSTLIIIIGISLVYDGISDIWIISRISKSARDIKKSLDNFNE